MLNIYISLQDESEDNSLSMPPFDTNQDSSDVLNTNNMEQPEETLTEEPDSECKQEQLVKQELSDQEVEEEGSSIGLGREKEIEKGSCEQADVKKEKLKEEYEVMEVCSENIGKAEPDTEAVSEDELPNESTTKVS